MWRETRTTTRLRELSSQHALDRVQHAQLERILEALLSPAAPTSVHMPAKAVDVHIADALSGLRIPEVRAATQIADLGAGAGLPGLPLAVALPWASVTLVESTAAKAAFIDRVVRGARLGNARAEAVRAEVWSAGLGAYDVVTARALAPLAVVCEYAAPLLCDGGALVVWRGARRPDEEEVAAHAAAELGLAPRDPVRTAAYPGSVDHHLHLYFKVAATPARFPRRPGLAAKRPLGGST